MAALYRVTVNCCTSGNCDHCAGSDGHRFGTPMRKVHSENITKEHAEKIARNWQEYKPVVSEM